MIRITASFAALLTLVELASAQAASGWSQCGGLGWGGPTTCVSGFTCTTVNTWYSQCTPAPVTNPGGGVTVTVTGPVVTNTVTSTLTTTFIQSCDSPPPTRTVTVTSCPTSEGPGPTPTTGLHNLSKAAGKLYFGSALDGPGLNDQPYLDILGDTSEFGQITPANALKWESTEPSRGTYTFSNADRVMNFARGNGQLFRGHTCVWHSQLPNWVSNGNFDANTLSSIVTDHCSAVVGRYKDQIYSWDIANEIFNDDGTWRSSVFYNTLNTTFVATALRAAHAADPATKLYLNDYNIDGTGAKSTAYANLVRDLKEQGVPIDGIGLQGHLIVGSVPNTIQQNIEQFTALGVEVAITELDIRMTLPITDAKLQQQKADYEKVVRACTNVPGCIGVTIWDYTDKYSWVPGVFDGEGAALPWDENLNKKPAYDGIVAGLAV